MSAHNGKTILIVDDEPSISELLTVLLSSQGYTTKVAASGRQALENITPDIDLVLMDMVLPDVEGLSVCRQIKTQSPHKDIPIIAISGKQNRPDAKESLICGVEDYLHKPFEPEELFAHVEMVLQRHELHLAGEFKRIINEESIHVRFQPIYFLKPMKLLGLEMLSRPQTTSPILHPDIFFKAALKFGVYYEVEMIGWRKALKMAAESFDGRQTLFLNCETNLLENRNFNAIKSMFSSIGVSGNDIFLEVTERTAVIAFDEFYKRIHEYRQEGFKIAVDDMGAGYSNLESIVKIGPEAIKLVKNVVKGVSADIYKNSMIKLISGFCRENGIVLIAEGIETKEDYEALLDLGVEAGQGYFLCRPTELSDLKEKRLLE